MTDSTATILAIIFGIGVFAVIVVVGWGSVQRRRILRMQGADGHETLIMAREDDEVTNIVTTTTGTPPPVPEPAPTVVVIDTVPADPAPADSGATGPERPV